MSSPLRVLLLCDKSRFDQPPLFNWLAQSMKYMGDIPTIYNMRDIDALHRHGSKLTEHYDAVCGWGWRRLEYFHKLGMRTLVIERGYMGDRFKWYSAGWNGLNGRAVFAPPPEGCKAQLRFAMNRTEFQPIDNGRHSPNEYVLLLGQVPSDTAVRGIRFLQWADRKSTRLNSSHVSESRMPSSA